MAKNTQEAEVIVTMNGQAAKKAVAELETHEQHGAAIREQVKQLILDMNED